MDTGVYAFVASTTEMDKEDPKLFSWRHCVCCGSTFSEEMLAAGARCSHLPKHGRVRQVDVKSNNVVMRRPVSNLCLLEKHEIQN